MGAEGGVSDTQAQQRHVTAIGTRRRSGVLDGASGRRPSASTDCRRLFIRADAAPAAHVTATRAGKNSGVLQHVHTVQISRTS